MQPTIPTTDFKALAQRISSLDLDPIKIKLMDSDEGEGWTREQVDQADLMYRRFLFLSIKYPDNVIVPNKTIDKFWHTHILDTRKYMEDCETTFGFYLHHFPYLGMRGEEDAKLLADSFDETKDIYLREFGEDLVMFTPNDISVKCSSECKSEGGNCWGGSCSGGKCNVKHSDMTRPSFNETRMPVNIFDN